MNILRFIGVFKNIMLKRTFTGNMEVAVLSCRERNCEEDIFRDIQKKIDFPKVISYFPVQIVRLDEQKQRAGKVNDEPHYKPEIRFLVDKDHLWFVHLVEQVEDGIRYDQNRFDRCRQRVETFTELVSSIEIHGYREDIKEHGGNDDDQPKYAVLDDRKQHGSKYRIFHHREQTEDVIDAVPVCYRVQAQQCAIDEEREDYIK